MIIRSLAIVATLLALAFVQLIGAAHQPFAAGPAAQPAANVAGGDPARALEDLAAWPAAAGR